MTRAIPISHWMNFKFPLDGIFQRFAFLLFDSRRALSLSSQVFFPLQPTSSLRAIISNLACARNDLWALFSHTSLFRPFLLFVCHFAALGLALALDKILNALILMRKCEIYLYICQMDECRFNFIGFARAFNFPVSRGMHSKYVRCISSHSAHCTSTLYHFSEF